MRSGPSRLEQVMQRPCGRKGWKKQMGKDKH